MPKPRWIQDSEVRQFAVSYLYTINDCVTAGDESRGLKLVFYMAHFLEAANAGLRLNWRTGSLAKALKAVDKAYAKIPAHGKRVSPKLAGDLLLAARPFFIFALTLASITFRQYAPHVEARDLERMWLRLEKKLARSRR